MCHTLGQARLGDDRTRPRFHLCSGGVFLTSSGRSLFPDHSGKEGQQRTCPETLLSGPGKSLHGAFSEEPPGLTKASPTPYLLGLSATLQAWQDAAPPQEPQPPGFPSTIK